MHAPEWLGADATLREALNDAEAFMATRFKLPPGGDVPPVTAARRMGGCPSMRSAKHCRNLSREDFHRLTKRRAISVSMPLMPGAVPAIHTIFPIAWTFAKTLQNRA